MICALRAIAFAVSLVLGHLLAGSTAAQACDICAIYTSVDLGPSQSGFRLGLAEQYTRFGTRMLDSVEVDDAGERLESSITQVLLGYNCGPRWGLRLNLPILYRPYRRLEDGALVSGSESGIGDLSLLATFVPFRTVSERGLFRLMLFGGVKFPTGNSDPLAEESAGDDDHPTIDDLIRERYGPEAVSSLGRVQHATSPSAIHGHDLALGTGSYDGVVGGQLFLSWDRFFWTTFAQYTLRTEGSFDYRYANDLSFRTGPGYFVYLDHRWSIGLQAVVAGDTKGQDTVDDVATDDTAATYLFAGPALRIAFGTAWTAEVVGDLPFVRHETGLQVVPDFRIRGGLVWRF